MFAAAFGAIQQMPRIVPGLPEVRTLARPAQQQIVSAVQSFQEFGGLAGRILLAMLAVRIVSRRRVLHVFQIPGLIVLPIVFLVFAVSNLTLLRWGMFLVGMATIAQFSFWGNYLPRVFPTYLRGTGEGFAANVHASLNVTEVAYTVANEGRRLVQCDRLSVAVREGRKVKIEAVSAEMHYASVQAFSRFFHRVSGETATEFFRKASRRRGVA